MEKEIRSELAKIKRKYLDSAEEIVSGYERECSLSKDYEGRQMFELLQNADDESAGSSGEVLITFDGKTLSVSNTGEPFSFRGVKSLLYPNASPKKIRENKIGCKGLGFRSILSWAKSVTVASKDFTIQFSKEYAAEFFKSILSEKPELLSEIRALSLEEFPIATLTCPHILAESALVPGFSTSIIIECKEDLAGIIESQITSLQFEELVFLPNLKKVQIHCNSYNKEFSKIAEGNEVIVEMVDKITGEKDCANWTLYKKSGTVFDEHGKEKKYEFIIAYDPADKHQGEVLYSYFKTDVKLGFPALIHGTFDLTSDRNSLQKNSYVNQQLIPILADFMVQTAVTISEKQKECNYDPLKLIISSEIDYTLSSVFHFDSILREKAREKKILPSISGDYIALSDFPKYSEERFPAVLNPEVFSTLLKTTDDRFIHKFLSVELSIGFYDYEDFCGLLNESLSDYSIEQKAMLAVLINREYLYQTSNNIFPHLLVECNGNSIVDSSKVYPLPAEEQVIELPNWVDIKFLSPDMEKLLIAELGIGNNRRELAQLMSRYNLEEYSFDRLLRGVVNQVDSAITSKEKCSDILNWLWGYYDREKREPIPDVRVKVICRGGEIEYARNCYIGSEYGNDLGERLIKLFSDKFVALDDLGLACNDLSVIAGFLEWLGASRFPRLVQKNLLSEDKNQFVKGCYPLYVRKDDYAYSYHEFSNVSTVIVGFFENFETILEQANFNDVLAWFLMDDEIKRRIYCETEEKNAFSCMKGYPANKQYERKVAPEHIKSYIHYYLSKTKWIPNMEGIKEKAIQCCFEDNALDPFIIVPSIDYAYLREIVGRNCKKDVDALLSRIGVADTFQEMDKAVIYTALFHLPELDRDHSKGKMLYRKMIRDGATPEEYQRENPAYKTFIENGCVLVKKNGIKQYVPINEARYADKKVFSEEILRNFSMLDADSRSGEEKIKKLFGVKPLKYENIETDGEPVIHPLDEEFKREYLAFLPFVYACRMGLKNSANDFRRLKASRIVLCSRISIRYVFENASQTIRLGEYEIVYLRKNNTGFICVPRIEKFDDLKRMLKFGDAVAELITAILDVNEDKEFYRDLFRENIRVREEKMRLDKGDENLEVLTEARKMFDTEINLRDEFWMALASVLKVPESEDDSANKLIESLGFQTSIDENMNYDDLSCFENVDSIIAIFSQLGIDLQDFNNVAVHTVDITKYWKKKLREKMNSFQPRYKAYLIDSLKDDDQCVQLFDKFIEDYDYLEPEIANTITISIDSVFEREVGVSFEVLAEYSETAFDELYTAKRAELDDDTWLSITQTFSQQKITAYLIFGRINELIEPGTAPAVTETIAPSPSMQDLVGEILSMPVSGLFEVTMQTREMAHGTGRPDGNQRKRSKKVHSEETEKRQREEGLMGEALVYKELSAIYPDTRWISGNAQKANCIIQGDDSCGYDIKYTDENGAIQYVEVKASKNSEIIFSLSSNELKFALQHSDCYEIIYVVFGEDDKPAGSPWRLGHLFDFEEGEDLLHNSRFSIESDNYCITALAVNSEEE